MSRSGYSDEIDQWAANRWRGQVASAIRGKRGQQFLRDLIDALDAMPEKHLITNSLEEGANVCAIGSVGKARGIDMTRLDPEDIETVAGAFNIADQLVREIVYENDEGAYTETPEQRWSRMRAWAVRHLAAARQESAS